MTQEQAERLESHVEQLTLSLIRTVHRDGIVRTAQPDGTTAPDIAATHHLLELLDTLDGSLFSGMAYSALAWMNDPDNQVGSHPFVLDSFALALPGHPQLLERLEREVVARQLRDGAIPIYTGYLPGGDFFSTLWAARILSRASASRFTESVDRALAYAQNRVDVAATSPSQAGFLAYLLARYRPDRVSDLQRMAARIADSFEADLGQYRASVDRLFLIEDLTAIEEALGVPGRYLPLIEAQLVGIFDLATEQIELPEAFREMADACVESLYIEVLCRAAIVAATYLRMKGVSGLGLRVNALIHRDYIETRYLAIERTAGLRAFLERYGSIHQAFSQYNHHLERAWERQPFEKSIFLMMPFRTTLPYRALADVIREECAAAGFHAVRVDDPERRFDDKLWDNLIINMLSCKAAIAVYASDPVVDRLRQDEVRFFPNPNVALEYGFFRSRGQDILLLKDQDSPLPSDLQGFLWHDIDIQNPDTTVPTHVRQWLMRLLKRWQPAPTAGDGGI